MLLDIGKTVSTCESKKFINCPTTTNFVKQTTMEETAAPNLWCCMQCTFVNPPHTNFCQCCRACRPRTHQRQQQRQHQWTGVLRTVYRVMGTCAGLFGLVWSTDRACHETSPRICTSLGTLSLAGGVLGAMGAVGTVAMLGMRCALDMMCHHRARTTTTHTPTVNSARARSHASMGLGMLLGLAGAVVGLEGALCRNWSVCGSLCVYAQRASHERLVVSTQRCTEATRRWHDAIHTCDDSDGDGDKLWMRYVSTYMH